MGFFCRAKGFRFYLFDLMCLKALNKFNTVKICFHSKKLPYEFCQLRIWTNKIIGQSYSLSFLVLIFISVSPKVFISRWNIIVRVRVVLNRTVDADSDWCSDNLWGSHLVEYHFSDTTHFVRSRWLDVSHWSSFCRAIPVDWTGRIYLVIFNWIFIYFISR